APLRVLGAVACLVPPPFGCAACGSGGTFVTIPHGCQACLRVVEGLWLDRIANVKDQRARRTVSSRAPSGSEPLSLIAGELDELVVVHEPAFLDRPRLHRLEELAAALLRNLDAELVGLDPDRVRPALLAEDDPAGGAYERGR